MTLSFSELATRRQWLVLLSLTLVGTVTHLLPHDMGVSTVGALGMLCAAYLPRHLLFLPVLVTVLVADLFVGGYALVAMLIVYGAHLLAAAAVAPGLKVVKPLSIGKASIISSVVFYAASNTAPMAMAFYPATVEGWIACYVNGLPFLLKGLFANLAFGSVAFGIIHLVGQIRAHRFTATKRH